jgi:hypothetical protein
MSILLPADRESESAMVTPGAIFCRTEEGGLFDVERLIRSHIEGAMLQSYAADELAKEFRKELLQVWGT